MSTEEFTALESRILGYLLTEGGATSTQIAEALSLKREEVSACARGLAARELVRWDLHGSRYEWRLTELALRAAVRERDARIAALEAQLEDAADRIDEHLGDPGVHNGHAYRLINACVVAATATVRKGRPEKADYAEYGAVLDEMDRFYARAAALEAECARLRALVAEFVEATPEQEAREDLLRALWHGLETEGGRLLIRHCINQGKRAEAAWQEAEQIQRLLESLHCNCGLNEHDRRCEYAELLKTLPEMTEPARPVAEGKPNG